jgi:hypothetical protein
MLFLAEIVWLIHRTLPKIGVSRAVTEITHLIDAIQSMLYAFDDP